MKISEIINPSIDIANDDFRNHCKETLDRDGVVVLSGFISDEGIACMKDEGNAGMSNAYFCASNHNVYLTPPDESFSKDHPRNREVVSSKGLIGDDQVPNGSPLKALYNDDDFQSFIAEVVGEEALYPYADPLSAVNIHYAKEGQELGWHFDNSSFAITLYAGTLVFFRGRNSIHRVTPTEGDKTRMLAVLAYNSEPGIELSESARMTFYGRLS